MTTIIKHQGFGETLLSCGQYVVTSSYQQSTSTEAPLTTSQKKSSVLFRTSPKMGQRAGFSMATPNPPTDLDYWGFSNPLLGAPQWGYPQEPRVNHDLLRFLVHHSQEPISSDREPSMFRLKSRDKSTLGMKDSLAKTNEQHMLHAPPLTNRLMESCVMESFFGLHVGIAQNDSVSWCIYQLGYADFQNSVQW